MASYTQPVFIRRRKKSEAEQAINDLLARGFELVTPLRQEMASEKLDQYSFEKRYTSEDFSSPWVAKLVRTK
ncbi:hypothetical protein [Bacillus massiliglaciei]|uniref:hypothetical protein n=1 Tax=Bacillus massiliglaciei TaxID=1816693 RepID=UPI000DA605E4|nr:hypothetical protein [Bacillus massiliglaciei]